jgi:uncharacterized glyoxalase superfamily protein PhnB
MPLRVGHDAAMKLVACYPLFTVARLAQSRDFFVQRFAMRVVFEAAWVVLLSHGDEGVIDLALMSSDHPSSPPGPETFDGRGMILTLQVDDAAAWHARLAQKDDNVIYPLTDAAWGQRRFMVRDPSGIHVDVVEQIDAAPGYWEAYAV